MDSEPVILDISSDEELCEGEAERAEEGQGWTEPGPEFYDWLSALLGANDKGNDDSDEEVVVVGEVNPTNHNFKSKSSKSTLQDDDEDCLVLDGDPDKPVAVSNNSGSGSDEVLIVGEKGQVACRDYPHPRHLCAKFPFSSTPHEEHCDLCHCYVCDSIAPCLLWGIAISGADHCHATDKEEMWKIMRKGFKVGTVSDKVPSNDLQLAPDLITINQVPILTPVNISIPQNQITRLPPFRPCSSTNFTVPNIISHGRNHQNVPTGKRVQPRTGSPHLHSVINNAVRRDNRVRDNYNIGSRFVPSNTVFKRTGVVGSVVPMGRRPSPYKSNHECVSQFLRNTPSSSALLPQPTLLNLPGPNSWQNGCPSENGSSSHLNMDGVAVNGRAMPSHQNLYNHHHKNQGLFGNQLGDQSQSTSQNIYQQANQGQTSSHQNTYQPLGNHTQESIDQGFFDFNFDWVNGFCQGKGQSSADNPEPESVGSTNIAPLPVKESSNSNVNESLNVSSLNVLENLLLQSPPSVPVVSDSSVPFHQNALSPDLAAIDPGMLLFDFETSWNGLTEV